MSLESPELDDTSYEQLVSTAKQRIAARTDEWTDFNPHDPGITIVELLAWLADTHIYEADQLTDAHRRKYLQLMGIEPTPPQPASVLLEVSPTDGGGRLPAGTRLWADDGHQQVAFETDDPMAVTERSLEAVVVNGEARTHANETDGMYYRLFGDEPATGDWFAVGFDGDPFDNDRLQLFVEYDDSGFPEAPTDDAGLFEPSVELCWEYCQSYPAGVDAESNAEVNAEAADWKPLDVQKDTTNSLYKPGFITLERPDSWEPTACESKTEDCVGQPAGVVWLRCRLTHSGYEIPPLCRNIRPNVVAASHCCEYDHQLTPAGESPAEGAGRTYQFEQTPVLSATVTVDGEQWTEVSDFDASGPTDCHYVLDRTAGSLTVGDGQRGSQPPAGASVRAQYEAGGGAVGNVPETARWSLENADRHPGVEIEPRGPATGGTEAEPLEAAIERCRAELETTHRAVTANEYGRLAELTPGVRIARSTVLLPEADTEPIEIVVVPYAPPDVRRPTPSEGFKQAVETYLDRRRLLGDCFEVRGPNYVPVRLELAAVPATTHTASEMRRQIKQHLEATLRPLGVDGEGWPFGKSLSESDLATKVGELSAVAYVDGLTIRTVGGPTVTTDGRVVIDDTTLFVLEGLEIECCEPNGASD